MLKKVEKLAGLARWLSKLEREIVASRSFFRDAEMNRLMLKGLRN